MAVQLIGVTGPVALIAVSALAVFSWFALHSWQSSWYHALYGRVFFLFPYGSVIPLFAYVTVCFFRNEWRRCVSKGHIA